MKAIHVLTSLFFTNLFLDSNTGIYCYYKDEKKYRHREVELSKFTSPSC